MKFLAGYTAYQMELLEFIWWLWTTKLQVRYMYRIGGRPWFIYY